MQVLESDYLLNFPTIESNVTQAGLYDAVTLAANEAGEVRSAERLTPIGRKLLFLFNRSLRGTGIDLGRFNKGGMYYRIIDGTDYSPAGDRGGRFHYDTGLTVPDVSGGSAHRFVTAYSSAGEPIQSVFSSNPAHEGRYVGDVMNESPRGLVQPPNGLIVEFSEGADLHGRAPRAAWQPGEVALFASFVLRSAENEVIICAPLQGNLKA